MKSIIETSYQLLKTDIFKFVRYALFDNVFNKMVWVVCSLLIALYVWPSMGMSDTFCVFLGVGAIVSCIFWDCWDVSVQFIADLDGNNITQYYLSLPIPAPWFFVKQTIFYAIRALIPALCVLPVIKLVLWNKLNLMQANWLLFTVVMISSCFFGATLSLFITSRVKDMHSIDNISIRFLFPIWFFGGAQFSWYTLYAIAPVIAKLSLINPLLYAMESMHVVFLGQQGYLPFWTSIGVLWIFNIAIGAYGAWSLMRRLDCV